MPRQRSRSTLGYIVGVLALVGVGWWLVNPGNNPLVDNPSGEAVPSAGPQAPLSPGVTPFSQSESKSGDEAAGSPSRPSGEATGTPSNLPPGMPPKGMSPDQWAQLQESLQDDPHREAEIQRVVAYMGFQSDVQRFHQTQGKNPNDPTLRPLAQQLATELDRHVERREISAAEGLLLKTELTQIIEPNDSARKEAILEWQKNFHPPTANTAQNDAQFADYKRGETQIIQAWNTLPEAQRDPQVLAQQLQDLRQKTLTK